MQTNTIRILRVVLTRPFAWLPGLVLVIGLLLGPAAFIAPEVAHLAEIEADGPEGTRGAQTPSAACQGGPPCLPYLATSAAIVPRFAGVALKVRPGAGAAARRFGVPDVGLPPPRRS